MKKVLKTIFTTLKIFVGIFMLLFVLVVFLQRFSNNELSFFNFRLFTVITGSMEPKYHVGDVLIAKKVDPSTLKEGDVISYLGKVGSFKDKIITHQITNVRKDSEGNYLFSAKGLANIVEDPTVTEDQLYGKVIYRSKVLTLVYNAISTKFGFYALIIIPILFVVGSELISTMLSKEEKRRNKEKETE